jgi:hypothetical protein
MNSNPTTIIPHFAVISNTIFVINGIYDILCAISILRIVHIPILDKLHLSVIKKQIDTNIMFTRVFAFWLITYGIMRLSANNTIIAFSYFIEAAFFTNEYFVGTVVEIKALFIIITSILLGFTAVSLSIH